MMRFKAPEFPSPSVEMYGPEPIEVGLVFLDRISIRPWSQCDDAPDGIGYRAFAVWGVHILATGDGATEIKAVEALEAKSESVLPGSYIVEQLKAPLSLDEGENLLEITKVPDETGW